MKTLLPLCLLLAACSSGDWPTLAPTAELLAEAPEPQPAPSLDARIAAMEARAAALQHAELGLPQPQ